MMMLLVPSLSSAISVIVVLVIVGVVLYLINNNIPMAQPIKTVINVIVILILCLWLLSYFGIWHGWI